MMKGTRTMDPQPNPMKTDGWIDRDTGTAIAEPVRDLFEYRVAAKPIRIEQTTFKVNTLLAVGNITAAWKPGDFTRFEPADGIDPLLVNPGRVQCRVRDGLVVAKPTGKTIELSCV
jgi:hypothetical protein